MTQAIYFDMDGTVADLYSVDDWLRKLEAEDPSPYHEAMPLVDTNELMQLCTQLISMGITIGIISWLSKNGTKDYDNKVRQAKKEWLARHMPYVQEVHIVKYGSTKKSAAKIKDAILVDDNEKVRKGWSGKTIDANEDILEELKKVLASLDNISQS